MNINVISLPKLLAVERYSKYVCSGCFEPSMKHIDPSSPHHCYFCILEQSTQRLDYIITAIVVVKQDYYDDQNLKNFEAMVQTCAV